MATCPVCEHAHENPEIAMNGDLYRCPGGHRWVVQDLPFDELETNSEVRERVSELLDGF
jgi:hypothetical protein